MARPRGPRSGGSWRRRPGRGGSRPGSSLPGRPGPRPCRRRRRRSSWPCCGRRVIWWSCGGRRRGIRSGTSWPDPVTSRRRVRRCSTAAASWPPTCRYRGCSSAGPPSTPARRTARPRWGRVGCRRCRAGAGARRGRRRPGAAQRRKILTAWPRPRRRCSPPCALPRHGRPGAGRRSVEAADRYDRAARPPRGSTVQVGPAGLGLRRLARRLVALRGPGRGDAGGLVALVVALAALTEEISAWHHDRGRPHQARPAADAAQALRRWQPASRDVDVERRAGSAGSTEGLAGGPPTRRRRRAGPGSARPPAHRAGRSDADADQAG